MASVLLTAISPDRAVNELVMSAAAADGNHFANTGKENVVINNGAGGALTVTVETPNSVDGDLAITDRTVVVPAGEMHYLGVWPKSTYDDGDEFVKMTYSSETSVTLAVVSPT